MDERDKIMKKMIFLILFGFVIGLVTIFFGHKTIQITGDLPFCGACHVMEPMEKSYLNDVHSGIGKTGVKAACVDCHLPHDNIFNYLLTKAYNGTKEVFITAIGKDKDIDWLEKLNHREKFTYDSGCLNCHSNITNNLASNSQNTMHMKYLDSNNTLSCVSCHKQVGHSGLRGELHKFDPEKYPLYK